LERLISAPALQFKGTGFYITDYAKNGKSPSTTGSNAKTESTGEGKSETKSESKPESKSDSKPAPSPAPASTSSEK
jgi:predicted nucleic acid-binding Zn ribbon protein